MSTHSRPRHDWRSGRQRRERAMVPTLASAWRKIRANEKSGLHGYRSQSEVITGVRLQGLSTVANAQPRSRASSVEMSSSRGTTEEQEELLASEDNQDSGGGVLRMRSRGDSDTPQLQLKVFVGSWNMAAKDPFATATAAYVGDTAAAYKLKTLLPTGYDLYVLGTQEKATKHLHEAVLARLHSAPEHFGRRFATLRKTPATRTRRSHSTGTQSGGRESESSGSQTDPMRHGSFALEASATAFADGHAAATTTTRLDTTDRSGGSPPRESIKEVRGRGDGAFLAPKSTSIAIYCACDLQNAVEIEDSATHKFSWSSGSKGGVAVRLRVASGPSRQTITFANCHLEANKPARRRQQLATLSTRLGEALGGAKDLASCSDHVVWMGDFNYRIHTLDGDTVLKLLASGKHLDVHDRYDSMRDDLAMIPTMESFQEPRKWPTFYPTYKKLPGRPAQLDAADPSWPSRVYRVRYKEPFYKGGQIKARVPGWCDRILFSSRVGSHVGSWLDVEQVEQRDNYRAVNDGLCESDHSPVFCTFDWTVSVSVSVSTAAAAAAAPTWS